MDKTERIKDLIEILNAATNAYDIGEPIMSDKDWDDLYFELVNLEKETDLTLPNSPTQRVNYGMVNKLEKVEHNHPLLSLDKTKSIEDLEDFIGDKHYTVMAKMDGLTISVRYADGRLVSAETRGNGVIGENVLHNALTIKNLPHRIDYKDELIIDGECIITYKDFEPFKDKYANPRNLAAGSIRLLDAKLTAARNLSFIAWKVYKGFEDEEWYSHKLDRLDKLGFTTVPRYADDDYNKIIENVNLGDWIEAIKEDCEQLGYPIDGCVIGIDSIKEAAAMGAATAHHEKYQIAYKFYDETYPSHLKYIDWTMSRNGTLTPVAVFDPIDIEGSTVERASLHNVSVMKEIMGDCCYAGQQIEVYKANQIIPQIKSAVKMDYGTVISLGGITVDGFSGDLRCPICGGWTSIEKSESGTEILVCENPQCDGKLVNRLDHFCSKKGLDIKGLSLATLNKLIDWGWIGNLREIFSLENFKSEWIKKPGFGEKSVQKILDSIESSKNCELWQFIAALGIPLIGVTVAKEICKYYSSWDEFKKAIGGKWSDLDGFGPEMERELNDFDYEEADEIAKLLTINVKNKEEVKNISTSIKDITFCITGKLVNYKNRDELKNYIESCGGKVVSSMSSKVQYLINNDSKSTSSKNKAAQIAGIPIITEAEFIASFGQDS